MTNRFKVGNYPDEPHKFEVQYDDGSLAVGFAYHEQGDAEAMARVLNAGTVAPEYKQGEVR